MIYDGVPLPLLPSSGFPPLTPYSWLEWTVLTELGSISVLPGSSSVAGIGMVSDRTRGVVSVGLGVESSTQKSLKETEGEDPHGTSMDLLVW